MINLRLSNKFDISFFWSGFTHPASVVHTSHRTEAVCGVSRSLDGGV